MQRDFRVYLKDILEVIHRIQLYTNELSRDQFLESPLVQDAVLRNLAIIGEAANKVLEEIRARHPEAQWKKTAGIRDFLVHDYFGVDIGHCVGRGDNKIVGPAPFCQENFPEFW